MTKDRVLLTRKAEEFMERIRHKNKAVHWCCDECPIRMSAQALLWVLVEHELELTKTLGSEEKEG